MDADILKKLSIIDYLKGRGVFPEKETKKSSVFSSPFSNDSNPSFHVYKDQNSFFDFSSGVGGTIIDLVMKLDNVEFKEAIKILTEGELLLIVKPVFAKPKEVINDFDYSKYLICNEDDIKIIDSYANNRSIISGYDHCMIYGTLAMGYRHVNEDLNPSGMKFRLIDHPKGERFRAVGRLLFYVLENLTKPMESSHLFMVESESSANSLMRALQDHNVSSVVLSIGGVGTCVKEVPSKYQSINSRFVIIDYDGKEDLYNERVDRLKHLGKPVKFELDKGADINSLYCEGKSDEILNIIKKMK